jgi:Protein of unknown function (DUF1688)
MRPLHFKGQSISRSKGKLCSSLAFANADADGHRFSAISSKAASGESVANAIVPLHKLSQWLTYSLIESLEGTGIRVTEIGGLTGLAQYRNGGLFVDGDVLRLKDPAEAALSHAPGSTLGLIPGSLMFLGPSQ